MNKYIVAIILGSLLLLTHGCADSAAPEKVGFFQFDVFLSEYSKLQSLVDNSASPEEVVEYAKSSPLINDIGRANESWGYGRDKSRLTFYVFDSQVIQFYFRKDELYWIRLYTEDYNFATVNDLIQDMSSPETVVIRKMGRDTWLLGIIPPSYFIDIYFMSENWILLSRGSLRNKQELILSGDMGVDNLYVVRADDREQILFDLVFENGFGTYRFPDVNSNNVGEYFYDWKGFGNVSDLYPNIIRYIFK
jgi:hypothetical protein